MNKKSILLFIASTVAPASLLAEPEFNFNAYSTFSFGTAKEDIASHATHGHDPDDEFTLQGLELSLHAKFNENYGLKMNYNVFLDDEDKLEGEWEDIFASFNFVEDTVLIKAGRFYNQINAENSIHAHAWEFANSSLLTTRFGGEEGLLSDGLEVGYKLPFLQDSLISLSFSDAVEHEEEEEEEGEEGEEEIYGDSLFVAQDIITLNWRGKYSMDDFNHINYRAHYSIGENETGGDSTIAGLGVDYEWRQGGYTTDGQYLIAGVEWINRDADHLESGLNLSENGIAVKANYGFNKNWDLGARYEYLEGIEEVDEAPELTRFSLAATHRFHIHEYINGQVRLQLDHEDRANDEDSQAAWLQFVFAFGKGH